MTEEDKRKCDSLEALRAAAQERFFDRRRIEFRLLLVFWLAIASFTVLLLKGELTGWRIGHAIGLTILGLLALVSFIRWIHGISEAHDFDRKVSIHFEGEIMKIAGIEFSHGMKSKLSTVLGERKFWAIWAYQFQMLISIFLIAVLAVVGWVRATEEPVQQKDADQPAAAQETKPQCNLKPQPDSKGRSQ